MAPPTPAAALEGSCSTDDYGVEMGANHHLGSSSNGYTHTSSGATPMNNNANNSNTNNLPPAPDPLRAPSYSSTKTDDASVASHTMNMLEENNCLYEYDYRAMHAALVDAWMAAGCAQRKDLSLKNKISVSRSASHMSNASSMSSVNFNSNNSSNNMEDDACSVNSNSSSFDPDEDTKYWLELASFLSVNCVMQKRQANQTAPKSQVKGRQATLSKLEQKASVLSEAGYANVERGPVILMRSRNETRSILKIRASRIISLCYGIILRWNAGLVTFIVLHKKAGQSFLNDDTVERQSLINDDTGENDQPSSRRIPLLPSKPNFDLLHLDPVNDTAVIQARSPRTGGTELQVLQPPWLFDRPFQFDDPSLSVTILRARGLRNIPITNLMPIHAYVKVSLRNAKHRTGVVKMKRNPMWSAKDDNHCTLKVENGDKFLKVEICDSKPVRNVLMGVVYVPLAMAAQMNESDINNDRALLNIDAPPASRIITVPCKMRKSLGGGYGSITLALAYHDPKRIWLEAELEAREKHNIPKETSCDPIAGCEFTEVTDWFYGCFFCDHWC